MHDDLFIMPLKCTGHHLPDIFKKNVATVEKSIRFIFSCMEGRSL